MIHQFLTNGAKFERVLNAATSSEAEQVGSSIDMQGFENVVFVASMGAIEAGSQLKLKIQQSEDGIDFEDIISSVLPIAADAGNKLFIIEIKEPALRYLRPVLVVTSGQASIDGITAIQLHGRMQPVIQGETVGGCYQYLSPS